MLYDNVKQLWKSLLSEGWGLWAKLDTDKKKFAVTRPSLLKSTNPKLFFATICKNVLDDPLAKLQRIFLENVLLSFKKLTAIRFMNLLAVFLSERFVD